MQNKFSCVGCGNCCKAHDYAAFVLLTDSDVEEIITYLKISRQQFIDEYKIVQTNRGLAISLPANKNCPFLTNDNKCRIYQVRPTCCKLFNGIICTYVNCAGVGTGKAWTEAEIDSVIKEYKDKLNILI